MKQFVILTILAGIVLSLTSPVGADIVPGSFSWSVEILIDESEQVFGSYQITEPRNNRGAALSPDGRYLYAGYNDGPEVRRIDLTLSGNNAPFVNQLTGFRGKAIATDDVGRVYLGEGSSGPMGIFSADLNTSLGSISLTQCEGMALARETGQLVMYASDRSTGNLSKLLLTESGSDITAATLDPTFGVGGIVSLAPDLRGVELDDIGQIWVAGKGTDTVYRISPDGLTVTTLAVSNPIDIGFDDDTLLVTRYEDRVISVFDAASLSLLDTISPDWISLGLDPDGQPICLVESGALSGIAMIPGGTGFYVTNETGQTTEFTETDGPNIGQTVDNNDPIFFVDYVLTPEPGSLAIIAMGGIGLLRRRRR